MYTYLVFKDQIIADWRIPSDNWWPDFGALLAVQYEGKLTLFRAFYWDDGGIHLAKQLPDGTVEG